MPKTTRVDTDLNHSNKQPEGHDPLIPGRGPQPPHHSEHGHPMPPTNKPHNPSHDGFGNRTGTGHVPNEHHKGHKV